MLSSTSSSDSVLHARAIRAVVYAIVVVGVALEAAGKVAVPLINHNQRRIREEYKTALTLGRDNTHGQTSVLLLGNSLTLTDIDVTRLAAELGPKYQVA